MISKKLLHFEHTRDIAPPVLALLPIKVEEFIELLEFDRYIAPPSFSEES